MSKDHVCPVQMTGLLDNPIRKFFQNPKKVLKRHLKPGDTAIDLGCGPGTFTIDIVDIIGPEGKVYGVDIQEGMLRILDKKAKKKRVGNCVVPILCTPDSLGVTEQVNFVLAFYMLHESREPDRLIKQIYDVLKPEGKFLLVEPKIHSDKKVYDEVLEMSRARGFTIIEEVKIPGSRGVVMQK